MYSSDNLFIQKGPAYFKKTERNDSFLNLSSSKASMIPEVREGGGYEREICFDFR